MPSLRARSKAPRLRAPLLTAENGLLLTLSIAEGCLLIDRIAVGLLAPWLVSELHLGDGDLGLLSAAFTLTFALSGYLLGAWSDSTNRRNEFLLGLILVFSAISSLTGLVQSLAMLVVFRIALGIAEGPFLPIAQAKMVAHSTPQRVAFNLAFLQQVGGFVLAQGLGSIVLTWIAQHHGWRAAFYFTGVPGFLILLVLWLQLRRPSLAAPPPAAVAAAVDTATDTANATAGRLTWRDLLQHRNVVLAGCIAACMGSWILLQLTFLPKYLMSVSALPASSMGLVMSMTGVSGCVSSLALPLLSNRWGRRPVLVAGTLAGLVMPLSMLLLPPVVPLLMAAVLVGSVSFGCSPLYVSILPSDVVPSRLVARAIAAVSACSAIVGGTLMPPLAGRLADHWHNPALPLWMAAGAALLASAFAWQLDETAPGLEHARGTAA